MPLSFIINLNRAQPRTGKDSTYLRTYIQKKEKQEQKNGAILSDQIDEDVYNLENNKRCNHNSMLMIFLMH